MPTRAPTSLTTLLLSLLVVGCAADRQWTLREPPPEPSIAAGDFDATLARAQAAWAERSNRDQLRRAVDLYELAVTQDPGDAAPEARALRLAALYTRIARARHLLGRAHLEPVVVGERALAALALNHDLGARAAERALAHLDPRFARAVAARPVQLRAHVGALGAPAAGPLLWWGANLAAWAEVHGPATERVVEGDIVIMLERSAELSPALYQAGALRELGAWRSRHARGDADLGLARAHFERAIDISPNLVDNRLLYAYEYAVRAEQERVFTRQLTLASETDPDLLPEWGPENRLAARRARRLLSQRAQLFAW